MPRPQRKIQGLSDTCPSHETDLRIAPVLRGYGDLRLRAWAGDRCQPGGLAGVGDVTVVVEAFVPNAGVLPGVKRLVNALPGKAIPHRPLAMNGRRHRHVFAFIARMPAAVVSEWAARARRSAR